ARSVRWHREPRDQRPRHHKAPPRKPAPHDEGDSTRAPEASSAPQSPKDAEPQQQSPPLARRGRHARAQSDTQISSKAAPLPPSIRAPRAPAARKLPPPPAPVTLNPFHSGRGKHARAHRSLHRLELAGSDHRNVGLPGRGLTRRGSDDRPA